MDRRKEHVFFFLQEPCASKDLPGPWEASSAVETRVAEDIGQAVKLKGSQPMNIPSGELTFCNGKWPFIEAFPIKNGDFPLQNVSSPEGMVI